MIQASSLESARMQLRAQRPALSTASLVTLRVSPDGLQRGNCVCPALAHGRSLQSPRSNQQMAWSPGVDATLGFPSWKFSPSS